jgi:hypothetical protein
VCKTAATLSGPHGPLPVCPCWPACAPPRGNRCVSRRSPSVCPTVALSESCRDAAGTGTRGRCARAGRSPRGKQPSRRARLPLLAPPTPLAGPAYRNREWDLSPHQPQAPSEAGPNRCAGRQNASLDSTRKRVEPGTGDSAAQSSSSVFRAQHIVEAVTRMRLQRTRAVGFSDARERGAGLLAWPQGAGGKQRDSPGFPSHFACP